MQNEYQIVKEVILAQNDLDVADTLIEKYLPFIKKEVYKFTNSYVCDNCDELSIAMIAFHEAIRAYDRDKGNFIKFASLLIRNRLIDFTRTEQKHNLDISLDMPLNDDENQTLEDIIASDFDLNETVIRKSSTIDEITEFNSKLSEFNIDLKDVADECPRQIRTIETCRKILCYAIEHREILDKMLSKHYLPMLKLARECDVSIKTIERHRKYIIAILLIQTNGYIILRDHIKQVMKGV